MPTVAASGVGRDVESGMGKNGEGISAGGLRNILHLEAPGLCGSFVFHSFELSGDFHISCLI